MSGQAEMAACIEGVHIVCNETNQFDGIDVDTISRHVCSKIRYHKKAISCFIIIGGESWWIEKAFEKRLLSYSDVFHSFRYDRVHLTGKWSFSMRIERD